ncbi:uncharacterized protein LOC143445288 isoform X3 [Clavelina lepadiformis]|uniref:uncharacterized protein LOC143445288 isoform X3 n=1 Tax=Clavelina lepadiformis TaxID=159417 RepID=UPI00404175BA
MYFDANSYLLRSSQFCEPGLNIVAVLTDVGQGLNDPFQFRARQSVKFRAEGFELHTANIIKPDCDRCQHPSFDDHESSTTVFDTKKCGFMVDVRRFRPVNVGFMSGERLETTTPIPCWLLLSMAQMPRLETSTSEDSPSNQKPPADVGSHDTLHVLRRKMPKQSRNN